MTHRHCFEAVDRTLRDILNFEKGGNSQKPFGRKVVVLGGGFSANPSSYSKGYASPDCECRN